MATTTGPELIQHLMREIVPLLGPVRAGAVEVLHASYEPERLAQARAALAEIRLRAIDAGLLAVVDAVDYTIEAFDVAGTGEPQAALGLGPYVTAIVSDLDRTTQALAAGADPTANLDHARAMLRAMPRPETTDLLQVDLNDREQLARVLAAAQDLQADGLAAAAGSNGAGTHPEDILAATSDYARQARALLAAPGDPAAFAALWASLQHLQQIGAAARVSLVERAANAVSALMARYRATGTVLSLDALELVVACQRIVPMVLAAAEEPERMAPAVVALEEQARLLASQVVAATGPADLWPDRRPARDDARRDAPLPAVGPLPVTPADPAVARLGRSSGLVHVPRTPLRGVSLPPVNSGGVFAADLAGILPRLAETVLALEHRAGTAEARDDLRLMLDAVGRAAVVAGLGPVHDRCRRIVSLSEHEPADLAGLLGQVHILFDDLERTVAGAVGAARPADRGPERRWLRVESQALEQLVTLAGELAIRGGAHEQRSRRLAESIDGVATARAELQVVTRQMADGPAPSPALARLMAIAEDLARAMDDLERARLESDAIALRRARVQAELEDGLRQMRLSAVSALVPRLERAALGAARRQGKAVRLVVDGGSTAVDAVALEDVSAALVQLVRNAVEHGIERPEERRRLAKPEQGTVRLRAFRDGSQTVMQVIDDGRGIAERLVAERAAASGYPVPRGLTRERLLQLIFLPGFSGKRRPGGDQPPDSGLDLVGIAVSGLQGTIAVDAEEGCGTTFTLRVPLVPSLTAAPVVAVAGERYVIPFIEVETADGALFKRVVDADGAAHTEYRGVPVRTVDLGVLLGVRDEKHLWEATRGLLLVRHGGERWLVRVDAILDRQNLVPQPLGRHTQQIPGAVGTTVLGSGQVALILDLAQLLDGAR